MGCTIAQLERAHSIPWAVSFYKRIVSCRTAVSIKLWRVQRRRPLKFLACLPVLACSAEGLLARILQCRASRMSWKPSLSRASCGAPMMMAPFVLGNRLHFTNLHRLLAILQGLCETCCRELRALRRFLEPGLWQTHLHFCKSFAIPFGKAQPSMTNPANKQAIKILAVPYARPRQPATQPLSHSATQPTQPPSHSVTQSLSLSG